MSASDGHDEHGAHGHDDWFRHASDEAAPQAEHAGHVSTKALGVTLLIIVFGVLFVILLLSAYFSSYTTQLKAEKQEGVGSAQEYMSYRSSMQRRLEGTGWIDRDAGTLHIPLERAMSMVVEDYQQAAAQGLTDGSAETGLAAAND